ncbi:MAG: hypothetical protein LDL10_03755 [Calditerrivibrio sp.]|nr:hypothetical protein [Calditerrivibrio sp.]
MIDILSFSKKLFTISMTILFLILLFFYSKELHPKHNICMKVGVIIFSDEFTDSFTGLQDGIKRHGYNNIEFEFKNIDGDLNKIENILNEFKKKGIKIVYATTNIVNQKIKELNDNYNFYIIFAQVASPEESKLVLGKSFSGTNFVGVTRAAFKTTRKRIAIFKNAFPYIKKIIVFYNPQEKFLEKHLSQYDSFTNGLGIKVEIVPIINVDSFTQYKVEEPEITGIFMAPSPFSVKFFSKIKEIAKIYRLPIMAIDNSLINKGATIAYSQSFYKDGIQSAYYLHLLIKGMKPEYLPIQMPNNMELFINKKDIDTKNINFNRLYYSYANKVIE